MDTKNEKEQYEYHLSFARNNPTVLPEGMSAEQFAARMAFADLCEFGDIRNAERHVEAIMKRHHAQQILK